MSLGIIPPKNFHSIKNVIVTSTKYQWKQRKELFKIVDNDQEIMTQTILFHNFDLFFFGVEVEFYQKLLIIYSKLLFH